MKITIDFNRKEIEFHDQCWLDIHEDYHKYVSTKQYYLKQDYKIKHSSPMESYRMDIINLGTTTTGTNTIKFTTGNLTASTIEITN